MYILYILRNVHPPLSAGGLNLRTNLQEGWGLGVGWRGRWTGSQFLEGGCWETGDDFFQGGCSFYIKNKLKSEVFNGKKSL